VVRKSVQGFAMPTGSTPRTAPRWRSIDTASQSVIGVIAGLAGAHGISVVPGIGKGFITNGKSGTW
jgi:hypothetical protein